MNPRLNSVLGLIIVVGAAACRSAGPPAAPPPEGQFTDRAELEAELARAAAGDVDRVWARILAHGQMPIVFGRSASFFYRGPGAQVELRGEFTEWWPSWDVDAERIGTTDLWRKTVMLLPRSRLDYKLVVDGEWMLDPHNPHQQIGGYGPNSEARMPDWSPSPYVSRRPETARGAFTDNLAIDSARLGYTVNYRVYTPPGLGPDASDLPTLFVTDGSDYYRDEMGALVIILDRLYEDKRLPPMVVVFVDPWDPERKKNRREDELIPKTIDECKFCEFLVEELIPTVAERFPTTADSARRGILGTSLGGLHAAYMGLRYSAHFGWIGMQSPAFHGNRSRFVFDSFMKTSSFPKRTFLNFGRYERRYVYDSQRVAKHLRQLGVDLAYFEAPEGHSWGHWRAYLDEAVMHFAGSDE